MLIQYFVSVHSAAAYWNLIAGATNPVRRNRIGPLKEGGWKPCLEKANLINDFFANIGTRLGRANRNFPQQSDRIGCSVTDITVYEDSVRRKLKAIKPNKSSGPDDIAPKLLKLAEPAIGLSLEWSILILCSPWRNLYWLEESSSDPSI